MEQVHHTAAGAGSGVVTQLTRRKRVVSDLTMSTLV
jgi:hypothetical protein